MSQTTWRGNVLVGEAIKNLIARSTRSLILLVIITGTVVSVSLGELYAARSTERTEQSLIAEGYTTVKVTADAPGVPAAACARLEGQRGILAAGGVGTLATVHAGSSPGLGFWQATSTGDPVGALSGVSDAAVGRPGLILSTDLANELGVKEASYLNIGGRSQPVVGVFPLGARDQLLGRIALTPTAPKGYVQACYVQFATGAYVGGTAALVGAFPGAINLAVQALVPRGPGSANPTASWNHRTSRFAWITAGIVLGGVGLLTARSRHHELSVYVLTGSRRSAVAVLYITEMQLILAGAALAAMAWTAFLAVLSHAGWEPFHAAVLGLVRTLLLTASLVPIGALPLFRRDLVTLLRERSS